MCFSKVKNMRDSIFLIQFSVIVVSEFSGTFSRIFDNISVNLIQQSPKSSGKFPKIFSNIPRNLLQHSLGISSNIHRNVKMIHSLESSQIFPKILVNILKFSAFPTSLFPFLYSWFYQYLKATGDNDTIK